MLKTQRSPRPRRQSQPRLRLLNAALEAFSRKGIEGATVEEICRAAGYSKGGFYFHFRRKEDLVIELMETMTGGQSRAQGSWQWPPGLLADLIGMACRNRSVRAKLVSQYVARVDALEQRLSSLPNEGLDRRTLAELATLLETGLQLQSPFIAIRDNHTKAETFLRRLVDAAPQPLATRPLRRRSLSKRSTPLRP